jgi:hypothetical protein
MNLSAFCIIHPHKQLFVRFITTAHSQQKIYRIEWKTNVTVDYMFCSSKNIVLRKTEKTPKSDCKWCLQALRKLFFSGSTALVGLGLLMVEVSRTHSDTPHSVGLLCTRDWPVAETSTWQNTTLTRDKHPCPWRNSNPQSQQASDRRPTP